MKTPIIIGLCCLLTLLTVMFLQAQTRGQENGSFYEKGLHYKASWPMSTSRKAWAAWIAIRPGKCTGMGLRTKAQVHWGLRTPLAKSAMIPPTSPNVLSISTRGVGVRSLPRPDDPEQGRLPDSELPTRNIHHPE